MIGDASVNDNDYRMSVNSAGPCTITLPASSDAGYVEGRVLEFKDVSGGAAANPITLARNGSLIEGVASDAVISTNYGKLRLILEAGVWWIS